MMMRRSLEERGMRILVLEMRCDIHPLMQYAYDVHLAAHEAENDEMRTNRQFPVARLDLENRPAFAAIRRNRCAGASYVMDIAIRLIRAPVVGRVVPDPIDVGLRGR